MPGLRELFASGRIVDLILIATLIEAAVLLGYRRLTGRGPAPASLLPNLAAGFFLLLALRFALADAGWFWLALWLTAALVAHLVDLARRWRA